LKLVIIFDEVHRLLPKFGGSGEGFIQIERAAREFRKWGVGLILISQVLTDFVGETKANINTEIQMRTRDQGDLDRIKNKYGGGMLQSLLKAATGTGMIENSAYNKGNPYFVSFRPLFHNHARLTDKELDSYNKYNDLIDDLEFQIDQMEEEGIDVFEMRLELKMALDKVKSGSFNMVDIYLEGLIPALKKEWTKLGKQPKKRQTKLVSKEELEAEMKKAKEEAEKLEGEEGGEETQSAIFKLSDGTVLYEPMDLHSSLDGMSEETYDSVYLQDRERILKWLAAQDEDLAKSLEGVDAKEDVMALIQKTME